MKKNNFSLIWCYLIFLTIAASTSSSENNGPYAIIQSSSSLVLSTIADQVQIHGKEVNQEMVQELLRVLEPVVDFDAIARAVMSGQSGKASTDQTERFTTVFKDTMVRLYLESFIAFEVTGIEITPLDPNFDPTTGRATVQMLATGNGNTYTINYSMRTNTDGAWKVRNIIVDGINLGLTYRNQFDGAMSRHGNDIEKVINNWSEEVEV